MENLELENAIVGVLFSTALNSTNGAIYPKLLDLAATFQSTFGGITLFAQKEAQFLWIQAVRHWQQNHSLPDYSAAADALRSRQKIEPLTLSEYRDAVFSLSTSIASKGEVAETTFQGWLDRLYTLAVRRNAHDRLSRLAQDLERSTLEMSPGQIKEQIMTIAQELDVPNADHSPRSMMDCVMDLVDYNQKVLDGEIRVCPLETGDEGFDTLISPVRGQLGVTLGPTGWGKTSFTKWYCDAIVNNSIAQGRQVSTLTISFEVTEQVMAARDITAISSSMKTPFGAAATQSGRLQAHHLEAIYTDIAAGKYNNCSNQFFRFVSDPPNNPSAVMTRIESLIASWAEESQRLGFDPSVVVIDYAQAMLANINPAAQTSAGASVGKSLRDLASKYDVVLWIASQVNDSAISNAKASSDYWFTYSSIAWYKGITNSACYVLSVVPIVKAFSGGHPFGVGEANTVHIYCSKNTIGPIRVTTEGDNTGILPMAFDPSDRTYTTIESYSNDQMFPGRTFDGSRLLPKPSFDRIPKAN